jgi:mRNA interferase MazF
MKRGDIYRVRRPEDDPKKYRSFVLVGRQVLIDSKFSSVICAPVYTLGHGLTNQVAIGPDEGMKHESWIACDNLVSVQKSELTQFVGSLAPSKIAELDRALAVAVGIA